MDNEAAFWELAVREGLPSWRFLRRPVPLEQLDREFIGTRLECEWLRLKELMRPGDQLWPFEFNVRPYLGLRRGYVLLRGGRPVGGVVTVVS
jgi:hypothetical protein